MTRHALFMFDEDTRRGLVRITKRKQVESLLLAQGQSPNAVHAAAWALLANGASEVLVMRASKMRPLEDEVKELVMLLSRQPAPWTVTAPLVCDVETLCFLSEALREARWTSTLVGQPQPVPLLWVEAPLDDDSPLWDLIEEALGQVVPVAPEVSSVLPGRGVGSLFPATVLAGAAWCALPGSLKGAHELARDLTQAQRLAWLDGGVAVLGRSSGRRVALTLHLPMELAQSYDQHPEAATRKAGRAQVVPSLEGRLQAILEEERLGGAAGFKGRLVRRWTSELERARREGILYGVTSAQAYRIVEVDRGEFEVLLRRAPRNPLQMVLKTRDF